MDFKAVLATVKSPETAGRRSKGALAIRYVEIPVAHWPLFQAKAVEQGFKGNLTAPLMRQVLYGTFDLQGKVTEAEEIIARSKAE